MYLGLFVSVLLHAALLGWALLSIHGVRELKTPQTEPVAVEMISPSDLTRLTQGSRTAKLKEAQAKEAPKSEPVTKKEAPRPRHQSAPPPPPPPEPEAKDTPPPPPAKSEPPPPPPKAATPPPKEQPDKAALDRKLAELAMQQAAEEKAKAEAAKKAEDERKAKEEADRKAKEEADRKAKQLAEAKRKAAEKRKAELKHRAELKRKAELRRKQIEARKRAEAKARFDADRLSALLDKTPDPRSAPAAAPDPKAATKARGPVLGAPEGHDQTLSASEVGFLAGLMRQAVSRCWNINAGLEGIDRIVVHVEVRLNRDGTLKEPPKVVNPSASPLFRDAADSAVRALIQCAPYQLPADKYDGGWEYMALKFDPKDMF